MRTRILSLLRQPGMALAGTLALAIGANTTIFSAVDGVLFKPLPVTEPATLIKLLATRSERGGHVGPPYHSYLDWRDHNRSFSYLTAITSRTVRLGARSELERARVSEVSPEYFQLLGTERGRQGSGGVA